MTLRPFGYSSVKIIERLVKRFELQDYPIDPNQVMILLKMIQPVTLVDPLLKETKAFSESTDLSAAQGTYVPMHTVPAGKRWTLKEVFKGPTTAASTAIAFISSIAVSLDVTGTDAQVIDGKDITMEDGQTLGMVTTGNGGDTSRQMIIIVEEEDSYFPKK